MSKDKFLTLFDPATNKEVHVLPTSITFIEDVSNQFKSNKQSRCILNLIGGNKLVVVGSVKEIKAKVNSILSGNI